VAQWSCLQITRTETRRINHQVLGVDVSPVQTHHIINAQLDRGAQPGCNAASHINHRRNGNRFEQQPQHDVR